jgi:hypothetical protein
MKRGVLRSADSNPELPSSAWLKRKAAFGLNTMLRRGKRQSSGGGGRWPTRGRNSANGVTSRRFPKAPAISRTRGVDITATLGATWKTASNASFSFFYGHAFKKTVNGDNSIPASFGGGNANVSLEENVVGIGFGKQF